MQFNFSGVEVFWDNDATLVDSEIIAMPHAVASVMAELARRGLDSYISQEEQAELSIKWAGKQISQMFKLVEERFGFTLDDDYRQLLCDDDAQRVINALKAVQVIPGIEYALQTIQQAGGYNSVVTSSSLLRVIPGLENNDLLDFFREQDTQEPRVWSATETLQSDDRYGRVIPKSSDHPEIYEFALDARNAKMGKVVAVEDSASGVGAAIRAGIPVVGLVAASHIHDRAAHGQGLRDKVKETLGKISHGKPVHESDIDTRLVLVHDPREIPQAIGRLLGLEPIGRDLQG